MKLYNQMEKNELGTWGEDYACRYLIQHGFTVLSRNFRFKKYEIDIVAKKNNEIVVVEVKTRQTAEIGEPWRAVTRSKQKQIIQVADRYVKQNTISLNTRFDIISIVHNSYRTELEHITHAFYPSW